MENGWGAGLLVAASSLLTIVFRDGVPAILRLLGNRSVEAKTRRLDTIAEYKDLADRIERDRVKSEEENRLLRADNILIREAQSRCEREKDRQATDIEYLQEALTKAGIPFRKRAPSGDSQEHTPLPNPAKSAEATP